MRHSHPGIIKFLAGKDDKQQRNFAKHLKRYISFYAPSTRVEILPTDRYTHITGKSELGVFATTTIDPDPSGNGIASRGQEYGGHRRGPQASLLILKELCGTMVPMPASWSVELDKEAAEDQVWANKMRGVDQQVDLGEGPGAGSSLLGVDEVPQMRKKSQRDFSVVMSERMVSGLFQVSE